MQIENSNQEFNSRVNTFETLLQNSTKEYKRRIKITEDYDRELKAKLEGETSSNFDNLERTIS